MATVPTDRRSRALTSSTRWMTLLSPGVQVELKIKKGPHENLQGFLDAVDRLRPIEHFNMHFIMQHASVDTIFFKHGKFAFAAEGTEHQLCDHVFQCIQSLRDLKALKEEHNGWYQPIQN